MWYLCFDWLGVSTVVNNDMRSQFQQFQGLAVGVGGGLEGEDWMVMA